MISLAQDTTWENEVVSWSVESTAHNILGLWLLRPNSDVTTIYVNAYNVVQSLECMESRSRITKKADALQVPIDKLREQWTTLKDICLINYYHNYISITLSLTYL